MENVIRDTRRCQVTTMQQAGKGSWSMWEASKALKDFFSNMKLKEYLMHLNSFRNL